MLGGEQVRLARRGASLVGLLCALMLPAAAPSEAAFPGENGKILYWKTVLNTVNPDGSGVTPVAPHGLDPAWSADGSRFAYREANAVHIRNADGSGDTVVIDPGPEVLISGISWAPDGQRLALGYSDWPADFQIYTINTDGTGLTQLTSGGSGSNPAWSPDGQRIAFQSWGGLWVVDADGANPTQITQSGGGGPDWSPDGTRLVFARNVGADQLFVVNADGSGMTQLTHDTRQSTNPAWSPDGEEIVFQGTRISGGAERFGVYRLSPSSGAAQLVVEDGSLPTWQPVQRTTGYPRPRGAGPLRVPLVPSYEECAAGDSDRTHGPPLGFPSCSGPQQASPLLTVGTPDANGAAANSSGYTRLRVLPGDPVSSVDEADVLTALFLHDVRNSADRSDYTGELNLEITFQITDRNNTPGSGTASAATVTEATWESAVPCTPTPNLGVGSYCELETSLDAVVMGLVKELQRSIWELEQIRVYDGGEDGAAATEPNNLFMTQGIFVP